MTSTASRRPATQPRRTADGLQRPLMPRSRFRQRLIPGVRCESEIAMNPERIYRQYRDEALAKQITALEYSTFVAMPFADRYSYHSAEIYRDVIQAAAERSNQKKLPISERLHHPRE
jgi:hypothetical protein